MVLFLTLFGFFEHDVVIVHEAELFFCHLLAIFIALHVFLHLPNLLCALVFLFGLFKENESIWGGSEKIFSGVINPDGTATLTGLEFTGQTTDQSTITETFTGMEIFILDSSDSFVNYGANNWGEFYSFPYTMPKLAASGSSIRMKKTGGKVNVSRSGQHLFRPFSGENHAFGYRSFTGGRKSASKYRSAEIAKAVKK